MKAQIIRCAHDQDAGLLGRPLAVDALIADDYSGFWPNPMAGLRNDLNAYVSVTLYSIGI
jgi:hypothetical protein